MPAKNWFSHDIDARKDDKLSAIKTKYGLYGYAIYFILLEIMRGKQEYKIKIFDIPIIENTEIKPFMNNGDNINLKEFLDFCCTIDVSAFRFRRDNVNPENGYYYSSGFKKRMEKFDKGRKMMSQGGKKGAITKWGTKSEQEMRKKYENDFEIAKRIIEYFNSETGKNYQIMEYNVNMVVSRLRDGFSEEDCRKVIRNKKDDLFLIKNNHVNIKTFFSPEKFEKYLNSEKVDTLNIGDYQPLRDE